MYQVEDMVLRRIEPPYQTNRGVSACVCVCAHAHEGRAGCTGLGWKEDQRDPTRLFLRKLGANNVNLYYDMI